ncbi:MAG: outer membrane beta-barrel protein [Chitinophagaceae bacterium]
MRKRYAICCYLLCSLFLSTTGFAQAQHVENPLNYGLRSAFNYSTITGLGTTILSEPYFINYSMKEKNRYGWGLLGFINYRAIDALALEMEIGYSQQGGDLNFNNYEKDFNYRMQFKYQYLNLHGRLKLYPFNLIDAAANNEQPFKNGLFIAGGLQVGANLGNDNIVYTSGGTGRMAAFGSDLDQQQQIRNVIKGGTNAGACFAAGFEFPDCGVAIDFRYYFSLTDVVKTQANSYNFIETTNTNKVLQFTISYDFSKFSGN